MGTSDRVKHAKSLWKNTGEHRPPFAIEPQAGQESVWDYPRPPVMVADKREMMVRSGETIVARTRRAVKVCETASPPTFYLPPEEVAREYLRPSDSRSFCEWKGQASYWSLALPEQPVVKDIAWSYEEPYAEFEAIAGYLSFYPARIECTIDGQAVQPQAGGFYGGWVTPELVGPFKGEPGTSGW